jgi:hypothetical protein
MTAAILIWSSQRRGYGGQKEDNNHDSNNDVTRKTPCQRAQPSIPEYLIIVWLCGNYHQYCISRLPVFIY